MPRIYIHIYIYMVKVGAVTWRRSGIHVIYIETYSELYCQAEHANLAEYFGPISARTLAYDSSPL
jgi:hypothetical protein